MSFLDELRDQFERDKSESDNSGISQKYVRMPNGKGSLVIRLLPPAPAGAFNNASNPFYVKSRVHNINKMWLHDPREEDPTNPKRLVGENPIAEYIKWLWAESDKRPKDEQEQMRARYRKLKPKKYHYFNCIVREVRDEDGTVQHNVGPLILRCGEQLYTQIMVGIFGDSKLGQQPLGNVADVHTGRDFRVVQDMAKSGDREYPNYHKSVFLDPSPLGTPEQIAAWTAGMHNLRLERDPAPVEVLREQLEIFLGTRKSSTNGFDPSQLGLNAAEAAGLQEVSVPSVGQASVAPTAAVSALPPTTQVAPAPVTEVAPVAAAPVTPVTPPVAAAPVTPVTPVTPPVSSVQTESLMGSDDFFSAISNLGSK